MNKAINGLKDIFLFPKRIDCYSTLLHSFDDYELGKIEEKLPSSHPIPSLNILLLLMIIIVPFAIIMAWMTGSIEKIIVVALTILGIGLLVGSIQITFGVIAVIFFVIVSFQNSDLVSASGPTLSFPWLGIFILLLPLALYMQLLANEKPSTKSQLGRLLMGILMSALGLWLAHINSGVLNNTSYLSTLFILAYVLARLRLRLTRERERVRVVGTR